MKRMISMILMLSLMITSWALAEDHQESENYTRYCDYQPAMNEAIGMIPGTDHSTLVLYFSRVGNTAFSEDVDAVSYATLNLNSEGILIGTVDTVEYDDDRQMKVITVSPTADFEGLQKVVVFL